MRTVIRVALVGNPNSGKSTVFNNLTGARQKVANYPGVTVEKHTGTCTHAGHVFEITDLPGTYGLTAHAQDEQIARDFLVREVPDVVVNILDASNLERSLYLTVQLMELGLPIVLAFNMSDVARAQGAEFDTEKLSFYLGAPIVRLVGHRNEGTSDLLEALGSVAGSARESPSRLLRYNPELDEWLLRIEAEVERDAGLLAAFRGKGDWCPPKRWFALKLMEQDPEVRGAVTDASLGRCVDQALAAIEAKHGESAAMRVADHRYGYISGACQETVHNTAEIRHTVSDQIDAVVTHRFFGIVIFLVLMYSVFNLTFTFGEPMMRGLEHVFHAVGDGIMRVWPADRWLDLRSLLVDGVVAGVGGVLVFFPNIMLLFLGIAVLEYSGYMARAAFLLDRLMHRIGLHGKSFIPMLLGFGCTVPGILATRTLDSERNRLVTMMILPLMSCGARLTIYALLIPAFFPPAWNAPILWGTYLLGILLAVVGAKVLGKTLFRGEAPGLVMELPPYRMPTARSVLLYTWERTWLYLRKAGTVILFVSILMWTLTTYPRKPVDPGLPPVSARAEQMAYSLAGRLGHILEPVLRPMGFDWRIGTALIGAVAAKEVVVAQLGVVLALGDVDEHSESVRIALRREYTPLTGFCLMLFCLIGFPCAATVAAVRAETGRWKWALGQFGVLTLVAWILTTAVYQAGSWVMRLAGS